LGSRPAWRSSVNQHPTSITFALVDSRAPRMIRRTPNNIVSRQRSRFQSGRYRHYDTESRIAGSGPTARLTRGRKRRTPTLSFSGALRVTVPNSTCEAMVLSGLLGGSGVHSDYRYVVNLGLRCKYRLRDRQVLFPSPIQCRRSGGPEDDHGEPATNNAHRRMRRLRSGCQGQGISVSTVSFQYGASLDGVLVAASALQIS